MKTVKSIAVGLMFAGILFGFAAMLHQVMHQLDDWEGSR